MHQLTVAGLGINDLNQMTLETLRALEAAGEVLYLGTTPERHLPQLRALGVARVRSIFELYVDGDIDERNYDRLYQEVTATASACPRVVLLVPGHPRIGVTLVQRLEKHRSAHPFGLRIFSGISSFDTMLNDLARDPLEKGSVLIDANRMLLFKTKWDVSLDCYIYHVCSVGTRHVHLSDARKDNAWDRLEEHLRELYPVDTLIELVSSSTIEGAPSSRRSVPLGEIGTLLPDVHFGTTLFIPGLRPRRLDREFLGALLKGS